VFCGYRPTLRGGDRRHGGPDAWGIFRYQLESFKGRLIYAFTGSNYMDFNLYGAWGRRLVIKKSLLCGRPADRKLPLSKLYSAAPLFTLFLVIAAGVVLGATPAIASWWDNNYNYRYPINSNAVIANMPFSINDTGLLNNTAYWTNNATSTAENVYLYCVNSGCASGAIAIANDTTEVDWENEITNSGSNPDKVWSNYPVYYGVWHMNEINTIDSTAKGLDGTAGGNGVTVVPGVFGNAVALAGSDDYVSFGTWGGGQTQFAMELWVKMAGSGTRFIAGSQDAAGTGIQVLLNAGGGEDKPYVYIAFVGGTDGQFECSSSLSENIWHHLGLVYNTTDVVCYIDGVYNGSIAAAAKTLTAASTLCLGGRGPSCSSLDFAGSIDEFRISNTTRTAAYMLEQYRNGVNQLTSLGAEEEAPSLVATLDLYLNGTAGNRSYTVDNYANFTAISDQSAAVIQLTSDFPVYTANGTAGRNENITHLITLGTNYYITAAISAGFQPISVTYYFNVTMPQASGAAAPVDYGILISFINPKRLTIMVR
jgi:hypothetical protein